MDIAAVVGLGNPGAKFESTRHNLGFRVVDEIARRWRVATWHARYHAKVARRAGGRPTWLVKPQTFMNLSAEAVVVFCAGEGIEAGGCLVVVDDVELPLGQLRLRDSGGPGTHNGLRSLVDALGEGFPRLRLGIRGEHLWEDLSDYVLARFEPEEERLVAEMVERAADCVETAVRVGLARAATQFNQAIGVDPPSE
jgi:PTH1 family peptidyl-tRNA hydrolase